ncbi:MAG: hypothetical protein E7099_01750 [Mediterranea massiliensis]|nr:hypothetical protein [Mediterranea massiliensis]
MLIADYYTINGHTEEDGQTIFSISLNPACKVYEGHFPGQPVSPGVCNIQMIKECVEQMLDKPLSMTEISLCRLNKLMTPSTHPKPEVGIRLMQKDGEAIKIHATISHDGNTCLEMKATFSPTLNAVLP